MAFKLISRPDPAPMEFLVTDGEAISYGQCLKFASGKLTKCGQATSVAAISQQDVPAGTGNKCKVIIVEPGQIWEADYTGTPDAGWVVGCATCDITDATGLTINAADVSEGKFALLEIGANSKCKVMCVGRALT